LTRPVDPYLARLARERLGHVRTTADLITHLEATLDEHRSQGSITPARWSVTLAAVIDHLWRLPNEPEPPAPLPAIEPEPEHEHEVAA